MIAYVEAENERELPHFANRSSIFSLNHIPDPNAIYEYLPRDFNKYYNPPK